MKVDVKLEFTNCPGGWWVESGGWVLDLTSLILISTQVDVVVEDELGNKGEGLVFHPPPPRPLIA